MTQQEDLSTESNNLETHTFLGFRGCRDLDLLEADIAILGVPIATPYPTGAYAAGAPMVIRAGIARYAKSAHHFDFDVGGPCLVMGARL